MKQMRQRNKEDGSSKEGKDHIGEIKRRGKD